MSPAIFRRFEHKNTGEGWRWEGDLDCFDMPSPREDPFPKHIPKGWLFAWTGESKERWVSVCDRVKLHARGYVERHYYCLPGTFLIAGEQVVFDRNQTIVVEERLIVRK